ARIEVSPAPVITVQPRVPSILEVGESAELSATTLDAAGEPLADRPMRWSSSDSSIAEIIGDRVVRARNAGVARLTCNCEGKLAAAEVAIVLPVVAKILIEPPPARVDLGLPVPLHAEVHSARGVKIERSLHWKAEPANVASVDAKGVVLPLREGRATITASVDGVEASVPLEVNPPPELAFPLGDVSATQVFELEEARRLLGLNTVSKPEKELALEIPVPNLEPAPATVQAEATDDITTPEDEAEADAAEVTVPSESMEPWKSVSAPTYADLAGANRFAFIERVGTKRLAGAGAGVLVLALLVWGLAARKSTPDQVVASAGTLAADTAHAGQPDTTPAVVPDSQPAQTPAPADSATKPTASKISIASVKPIRVGDSATLRAKLPTDVNAKASALSWTSSNPNIARVNQRTGRVVAMKEGSATITATLNGTTGSVLVRVIPGGNIVQTGKVAVAQLITSDVKSTMHPGDTVRVTAAPLDAKGASLLDRRVAWQSVHPEVASVDAFGLVTAKSPGTTEILATSEQQTARIPVTVAGRNQTFADAPAALRNGTERFLSAVADHDARQLAGVIFVETPDDQKNLDWLLEKVRAGDANLRVTKAQSSRPSIRDAEATSDATFTMTWTGPNGKSRETKAKFRVHSTKGAEGWSAATLRALDKLE
ncbi:MAG TPA: Ig-like domain-containing protein, partial [Gemmatimonadaceae bacterium]|nr:Ig-like domain-containing protein [Gemmatimonadaceae bacterium]